MTKENNLIVYNNFNSAIQNLSDENAGKLFKTLLHYNITGEVIESNELVNFAFLNMKSLIDVSKEKYKQKCEKNRQNRLNAINKNNDNEIEETLTNDNERQETLTNDNERQETLTNDEKINQYNKIKYNKIKYNKINNNNKNINKEEQKEIKALEKLQQYKNPDLMFDKKIDEVFKLYKKKCPNLCPLVFEERNIERRQQVKDLLILCRYDFGYIEGLFNRANEQIIFFDEKINFQSLIKNHEKIYQGIGAKKPEKKETAETMQEKFAKWEAEAKEREARENNDINW